jgi:hypothetical protein
MIHQRTGAVQSKPQKYSGAHDKAKYIKHDGMTIPPYPTTHRNPESVTMPIVHTVLVKTKAGVDTSAFVEKATDVVGKKSMITNFRAGHCFNDADKHKGYNFVLIFEFADEAVRLLSRLLIRLLMVFWWIEQGLKEYMDGLGDMNTKFIGPYADGARWCIKSKGTDSKTLDSQMSSLATSNIK